MPRSQQSRYSPVRRSPRRSNGLPKHNPHAEKKSARKAGRYHDDGSRYSSPQMESGSRRRYRPSAHKRRRERGYSISPLRTGGNDSRGYLGASPKRDKREEIEKNDLFSTGMDDLKSEKHLKSETHSNSESHSKIANHSKKFVDLAPFDETPCSSSEPRTPDENVEKMFGLPLRKLKNNKGLKLFSSAEVSNFENFQTPKAHHERTPERMASSSNCLPMCSEKLNITPYSSPKREEPVRHSLSPVFDRKQQLEQFRPILVDFVNIIVREKLAHVQSATKDRMNWLTSIIAAEMVRRGRDHPEFAYDLDQKLQARVRQYTREFISRKLDEGIEKLWLKSPFAAVGRPEMLGQLQQYYGVPAMTAQQEKAGIPAIMGQQVGVGGPEMMGHQHVVSRLVMMEQQQDVNGPGMIAQQGGVGGPEMMRQQQYYGVPAVIGQQQYVAIPEMTGQQETCEKDEEFENSGDDFETSGDESDVEGENSGGGVETGDDESDLGDEELVVD